MVSKVSELYDRIVLGRPSLTLVVVFVATLGCGWFAQDFGLDATTDSLTLERDQDLNYYRSIRARYGSDEYLIVTFTPSGDLFSEAVLSDLRHLRDAVAEVPGVDSVVSILDVPLIRSPPVDLRDVGSGIRYLEQAGTDRRMARSELLSSPLYLNLIISPDATTTAMRVDFEQDDEYLNLFYSRNSLREKRLYGELTAEEEAELRDATDRFQDYSQRALAKEQERIAAIRAVLAEHSHLGRIHLGGVPMIVSDSIDFIRHDLLVFGAAVFVFLVVILAVAFHKPRWVILPLVTCLATCMIMLGVLGCMGWRVTVVSSNFVPLMLILCLALTLHIIVRYRELHAARPDDDQVTLVRATVRRIVVPCSYTALTTMVAFGSLIVSNIEPVIDFGWMMVMGMTVAFILSFTLFPAALVMLEPGEPRTQFDLTAAITAFFARLITRHSRATLIGFALLALVCVSGVTRLTVENRFIDYYRKSTEIYQGMELIDRELGGTTPLEVIIDAPVEEIAASDGLDFDDDYEDEFEDSYSDESEGEAGITATSHWFNSWRLPAVREIHDFLDSLPETGKVLSIGTAAAVLEQLDPEILTDNWTLSIVYQKLPDDVRDFLFSPYLSDDGQQLRFSIRVFESDPTMRRAKLIDQITSKLIDETDLGKEQVHVSGMLVLYNNMLQSLFRSQILTLGAVFFAIALTFVVLFRSVRIAVIATIPNLLAAGIVLGIMGWAGIALDIMTITIAAITIGIGVDDTIHYVHRFETEFEVDRDYWAAIRRSHATIGRAMYYTTVTIMLGFSILALSRFVPTIYFGLLTALSMLVALLADLALLPVLIATFHAEGRHATADR
jgi:predicted RND superfamily exporter protein